MFERAVMACTSSDVVTVRKMICSVEVTIYVQGDVAGELPIS